ncbi:MarR family winged helix-turn-helix transcriptional regulator [Subtercola boreus]|nr:MarR family transcriptional regulator [Subtercola boreus]
MALLNEDTITTLKPRTRPVRESDVTEFALALNQLDIEHRRLRTRFADHFGLTHTEYDAFTFVADEGTTTPKNLAANLRFTTGATTALIDRLEKLEFVHRTPNPTDRRSVHLELTPHGASAFAWVGDHYLDLARTIITAGDTKAPKMTSVLIRATEAIGSAQRALESPDERR